MFFALLVAPDAQAFCGYYAGHDGEAVVNTQSVVVVGWTGTDVSLTLASDFSGNASDFALLVPVPAVLGPADVSELDPSVLTELAGYSAPRLVSYPVGALGCYEDSELSRASQASLPVAAMAMGCQVNGESADTASGTEELTESVTVEAQFVTGVYEILVLSAEDSTGLQAWLDVNGFSVPVDAATVLQSYIDQGNSFLVARVWLGDSADSGDDSSPTRDTGGGWTGEAAAPEWLPPLQIRYASTSLTLPLRLGALSSSGSQDLLIYGVMPHTFGALAVSNLPEAVPEDECLFLPDGVYEFSPFYEERFADAVTRNGGAAWVLEYAWEPEQCDPCTTEPLSQGLIARLAPGVDPEDTFFSRLHLRYTPSTMTEDLGLYASHLQGADQERYIAYSRYTAAFFPVCDLGWVDGDATCSELGMGSGTCGAIPLLVVTAGALLRLRAKKRR